MEPADKKMSTGSIIIFLPIEILKIKYWNRC